MEINNLFEKIVQLEGTSESVIKASFEETDIIRNNTKRELEVLKGKLKKEEEELQIKLEKERKQAESEIKNKHLVEFESFSKHLSEKFKNGLEKIIILFSEQNRL